MHRLFLILSVLLSNSLLGQNNAGLPLRPPLELTSDFAEYRKNHFHSGIDLRVNNKPDKSVLSIWEGYVSRIRYNSASYGRAVYVTHPNGYTSVYGHLDAFATCIDTVVSNYQYRNQVFETDMVLPAGYLPITKGQVLGIAGNSGYSFGAHLHFEIRDTKTEEALNPLSFIPLDDNIDPIFQQLLVYRMQTGGFLPAKSTAYKCLKKGTVYSTAAEVMVPDTFFLGVDVQDFQSPIYYRLLPKIIEISLDDTLVWKAEFDRFSFDQSTSCRGVFDHDAGLNKKQQIVTTYTGNHRRQGFYKVFSNDGLFVLHDNNPHKLTIKATDTEFNTSVFQTTLRCASLPSVSVNAQNIIHTNYFHEFSTENISLKLDTGTFYANLALQQPLIIESGVGKSMYWTIGYTEIPLLKPITVEFLNDSMLTNHSLFVQMENFNIQKAWKPTKNDKGVMMVKIDRPGIFKIFEDTIAPTITKTNIPSTGKLPTQNEITFTVTDNSGTMGTFNAWINDEWTLMTYDLKYNAFAIPLTATKKAGLKTLRVEFSDLAGNKASKQYSF